MSQAVIFLILFSAFSATVSARQEIIEKVIGDNDLVRINDDATNIPARYRKFVDAFGMMEIGCTVTHMGRGYVITAGHCFWAPPEGVENTNCEDTKIMWGFRGNKEPYLTSKCEKVIAAEHSDQRDYAIVKVSPVPPVAVAPDITRRAVIGDTLTVFSHPEFEPLQWSKQCGVERTSSPLLPPGSLQHKCDTNPGSSGAPLINILSLKIVAIHDGGALDEDWSGNGMNYGTFLTNEKIASKLKELGF